MERWASGIDTAWLQLDQPTNRVVVHGVLFCDGPVDLAALRERIAERWVAVYPGLRQRPTWPAPLGHAKWVDDPPDLEVHVREIALDPPGDDAALADLVSAVMSEALPEDRPWWAVRLVTGFAGSGSAVLVSLHHGLGDGVALNHLFHRLSDTPAVDGTPAAYALPPRTVHGRHDVTLLRRHVSSWTSTLVAGARAATSPAGVRDLRRTGDAVGRSLSLLARPPAAASSALQGQLGEAKSARWTDDLPLSTVKAEATRLDATVNDVLCAAIAGALRTVLGDDAPGLRAVLPFNLRDLGRPISEDLGNEFGLVLPSIPTQVADRDERVRRMHRDMDAVKRSQQALATFGGIAGSGLGRRAWTQALVRRYADAAAVIISNVPGPRGELTLAGATVRDAMFWVPCSGDLALGVSVLSYAGRVRLGVVGDDQVLAVVGGVDAIVGALDEQLSTL